MKAGVTLIAIGVLGVAVAWIGKSTRPPRPRIDRYDLPKVPEDRPGHTDPPAPIPGERVKLTVHVHDEPSVFGRWRALEMKAEALPSEGITWEPLELETQTQPWAEKMHFGYYRSEGLTADTVNRPLRPWIRFRLPDDPTLRGKTLKLRVSMKGLYPFTRDGQSYETRRFAFDREVSFQVGSEKQIAEWKRFQADTADWKSGKRFWESALDGSFALLAITLVTGIFLIVRSRR